MSHPRVRTLRTTVLVRGRPVRVFSRSAGGGAGTPVLLVHGLGLSSRSMLPLLRRLAGTSPVHALDLPGCGATRGGGRAVDLEGQVSTVRAWLDTAGWAQVVLVGHSLGAQVVAELAAAEPRRVRAVVLIDPSGDRSASTVLALLVRLTRDAVREPVGLWLLAGVDYLRAGPVTMAAVLRRSLRRPLDRVAGSVPQPTLVLRGSRDPVSPAAWCAELVALLPAGQLVTVDGPHGVPFARPDAAAAQVLAFTAAVGGDPPTAQ